MVHLNETEIEVFTYSHFLNRPCKRCSGWTHWKQAPRDLETGTESVPSQVEVGSAVAIAEKPVRKHARTRLKAVACRRQFGHGDQIVEVSDISRGGFRFTSLETYPTGLQIDVAVPYLQDAANIFILARVVWSRQSGSNEMKEYGVEYVRAGQRVKSL